MRGWFSRLVLVSSLALTVSLGVIAATPSGFVWLRALESYGFIIETFEVDGSLRVLLRRGGTFVETAVGYHAAFVNYRELMVLQQPAYIDSRECLRPAQLLVPFDLPLTPISLPNACPRKLVSDDA